MVLRIILYSEVVGQKHRSWEFFALEFFVGEGSFIELSFIVLRTIQAVSSSQDAVEFTVAYSSFKRLRLKPPSAQILSTQRRSVPVKFRVLGFR